MSIILQILNCLCLDTNSLQEAHYCFFATNNNNKKISRMLWAAIISRFYTIQQWGIFYLHFNTACTLCFNFWLLNCSPSNFTITSYLTFLSAYLPL